mmetsp:Transcript_44172/g.94708  ORF Transcript_44172/g.94708 Transcript_44172/m.94708 type:complete len:387 (-) Transcript_44172:203-1363(-)
MSLYTMTEVEAFRAQVLLEEALKKLSFLTSISSSASVHGDELTQFMGDEISRIIQEQRDLEAKYEALIAQRGQLKGLCNKAQFVQTQLEIQGIAHNLKESNKSLCRNLKENPNVAGNLQKMQAERAQVQEWLEETKSELIELSFNNLVSKVEAERREQERLQEVRKKEREATANVKTLEADLQRELAENERETKVATQEIKELKEELQKNKLISDIEFKFEEKKLRAKEQALLQIHAQKEKKLNEELQALMDAQVMEHTVHERCRDFLEERVHDLQAKKEQWQKDSDREVEDRSQELQLLNSRRQQCVSELQDFQDRRRLEAEEQQTKEAEMRNAVLVERQRREQVQRMADAVIFIQAESRKFLKRRELAKAAMKGKKGKKGGKKK